MGVALWYENRVDNSKAKKDLDAFGKYAEKFGKSLFNRFLGVGAVIGTAQQFVSGLGEAMTKGWQQSMGAAKLDTTVGQFAQISRFAELTGFSMDVIAKKLAEGGADAEKLQKAMEKIAPKGPLSLG